MFSRRFLLAEESSSGATDVPGMHGVYFTLVIRVIKKLIIDIFITRTF